MIVYCQHDECKAEAVQNLRWMADVIGWGRNTLSNLEAAVLRSQVRCTHIPNPGRIKDNSPQAPFPP